MHEKSTIHSFANICLLMILIESIFELVFYLGNFGIINEYVRMLCYLDVVKLIYVILFSFFTKKLFYYAMNLLYPYQGNDHVVTLPS